MAVLGKVVALALIASVLGLVIRRTNPELTLLLGALTSVMLLLAVAPSLSGFRELKEMTQRLSDEGPALVASVWKCTGIAIVTRLGASLCRDCAQNAVAATVELAGTVCAMGVALPVIMDLLTMIGGLL